MFDFPKEQRALIVRNNEEGLKVADMKYSKLWLVHKDSGRFMEEIWNAGSVILIQRGSKFVLVYNDIVEFKLQPGDKPLKFMSPMGNNDSPYPYLIGEKYIYFIFDGAKEFMWADKGLFDMKGDIINQYLGINGAILVHVPKGNKVKTNVLYKL